MLVEEGVTMAVRGMFNVRKKWVFDQSIHGKRFRDQKLKTLKNSGVCDVHLAPLSATNQRFIEVLSDIYFSIIFSIFFLYFACFNM